MALIAALHAIRRRRSTIALILAWSTSGFVACGGQVDTSSGSDEETPPAGTASGQGDPNRSEPLDECEPGFPVGEVPGACNWTVEDLCYETKAEACACACPTERDSTCSSGLPVRDGRVAVTCR